MIDLSPPQTQSDAATRQHDGTPTAQRRSRPDELRIMFAAMGAVAIVVLAFSGDATWGERLAQAALATLAAACVFGAVAVHQGRRAMTVHHRYPSTPGSGGWRSAYCGVAVAAVAVTQTWFQGASVIATGDLTVPNGTAWVSRMFSTWSFTGNDVGSPGIYEIDLPWGVLLRIVTGLGGSPALAQRLWFTALVILAAVGALYLLQVIGVRPVAAVIGAGAFVLNPYVVSVVGTNPVYWAAMVSLAGLPAILLATITGRLRMRTAAVLFALAAPLLGTAYQNPPLFGLILLVLGALPIAVWWWGGRTYALRALKCTGISTVVLLAASAYWLIPALIQAFTLTSSDLAAASSWFWTEGRATVRNGFALNNLWAWPYPEYFPYSSSYSGIALSLSTFLLPAGAFASLVVIGAPRGADARTQRSRLAIAVCACATALLVVFLSTGTNPPGYLLFDRLYSLPYGWLLREPGRFLMLAALCYAVALALAVDALTLRWSLHRPVRRPVNLPYRVRSAAVIALAVGAVVVPGYPIVVGAVVPDQRPVLPAAHVVLPDYWPEMAATINREAVRGSVLVLPPDDFYQMGYTWGYYGTDRFISDLLDRHAVVPSSEGYTRVSPVLLQSVRRIGTALESHQWNTTRNLLRSLGTPLILVRGDIQEHLNQRQILSPQALSAALSADPDVDLVAAEGPLRLYLVRGYEVTDSVATADFATIDTTLPDLTLTQLLPGVPLVTHTPIPGKPSIIEVPSLDKWTLSEGEVYVDLGAVQGVQYQLAEVDNDSVRTAPFDKSDQLLDGLSVRLSPTGRGYRLALPTGRVLLSNGDFTQGPWSVTGDCYNTQGPAVSVLQGAVLANAAPGGLPALHLSATTDSACQFEQIPVAEGPLFVSILVRHISGIGPRMCVWSIEQQLCMNTDTLPMSTQWTRVNTVVSVPAGTHAQIYLYADTGPGTGATANDYADVRVFHAPAMGSLALMGSWPARTQAKTLTYREQAYGTWWTSPSGEHVAVDGMFDGWITSAGQPAPAVDYKYEHLVLGGFALSAAVGLGAFVAIGVGCVPLARRLRLLRRRGIP